jgi:SAM-dependent methyltransferase
VLRALAAQGITFILVMILAWFLAARLPFWTWPLVQGGFAAVLGQFWGLNRGWLLFQMTLPFALAWQLGHAVPIWIYPVALLGLLLVFGGGLLTRVPLYNSSHAAWKALLDLLPEGETFQVADLGAGLGGPLSFLARRRPDLRFTGMEASPLVWLLAWLRTGTVKGNCRMRFGSFWNLPLGDFRVVYAFLSPAPMTDLWVKARKEMKPGSILISNTFSIPDAVPEREIRLPDRQDARLLVYRL